MYLTVTSNSTTYRMCYRVATATMVTLTHHNVVLYINCLFILLFPVKERECIDSAWKNNCANDNIWM